MPEGLKNLMPGIAGALAFLGVLLAVFGASMPARRDPIMERIDAVTQGRRRTLEEIEMQAPFMERFVRPFASQMAKLMARLTPMGAMESTQKQLMHAGRQMQVSDFMGIRGLALLLAAGLAVGLSFLTGQGLFGFIVITAILGIVAYILPTFWLRGEITKRKAQILRALPDAIDLLTISVEAGLGFDQALARVVSKSDNALTREFARVMQEMRIGVARRDALRSLVERVGVEDLSSFISAIIQAEQLGASVGNVLRIQSNEMRIRRRQHVERLAQTAPIKMLVPMAFLIFPPIFIVVLGPAIPGIVRAFAPGFPL
jgi:tight adherence protein C